MKVLFTALLAATLSYAQEGSPVNVSDSPPQAAYSTLLFYDGSSNLIYACKSRSVQPTFQWTRAATTITDIVDNTNTSTVTTSAAHGLAVGNKVTISGATVDADLNGTYFVQTVGSTTSFTITTASVTDATYTEATLVISTTAPRDTAAIWSIQKFVYSGTNLTNTQWAEGKTGAVNICANRATSTGATKITYQ